MLPGGVILLIVGAFVFWRVMKRRRQNRFLKPFIASAKPPRRRERLLAKVPFLQERLASRGWVSVQDAQINEKRPSNVPSFDLLGYMPDKPIRAMFTARRSASTDEESDGRGHTFGIPGAQYRSSTKNQLLDYQQHIVSPISSDQDPPASPYQSSESSLSSAFGNGTHIPPTPLHPPPAYRREEYDGAPVVTAAGVAATTKRDTVYTQTSVASSVPRFRTINSWVRQQTSRIQEPPLPDTDFTMVGGADGAEAGRLAVPRG